MQPNIWYIFEKDKNTMLTSNTKAISNGRRMNQECVDDAYIKKL